MRFHCSMPLTAINITFNGCFSTNLKCLQRTVSPWKILSVNLKNKPSLPHNWLIDAMTSIKIIKVRSKISNYLRCYCGYTVVIICHSDITSIVQWFIQTQCKYYLKLRFELFNFENLVISRLTLFWVWIIISKSGNYWCVYNKHSCPTLISTVIHHNKPFSMINCTFNCQFWVQIEDVFREPLAFPKMSSEIKCCDVNTTLLAG